MSSQLFEPRRVADRAVVRWTVQALGLIARAPMGFGVALIAAALIDRVVLGYLAAIATPAQIALVGAALYWPLLGACIVAARSADNARSALRSARLWRSAIGAAVIAAGLCALGIWIPAGSHASVNELHSLWPLAVRWGSLASYALGTSFLPLMAFSPASRRAVLRLSWLAHRRNLQPSVNLSLVVMLTSTLGVALMPAALAVIVIAFHGALFYVAYREIFEGRALNEAPAGRSASRLVPALAVAPAPIRRRSR